MEPKKEQKRLNLLDSIRGVMLISMICYHAVWNLVYIYGIQWEWYQGRQAYFWQQSICWTFILLSGFCFSLGKRHWKDGILVSLAGLLVTAVTMLVLPKNQIIFGVLTCIGACILIVSLLEKVLNRISPWAGMAVFFVSFLVTKNINYGYLGIKNVLFIRLAQGKNRDYLSAFLGIPFKGFFSTDYFSLFPWLFLFITGFFLCKIFKKHELIKQPFMTWHFPLFSFLGRHSLVIYLLHQPVIYGLQELYFH